MSNKPELTETETQIDRAAHEGYSSDNTMLMPAKYASSELLSSAWHCGQALRMREHNFKLKGSK